MYKLLPYMYNATNTKNVELTNIKSVACLVRCCYYTGNVDLRTCSRYVYCRCSRINHIV